MKDRRAMFIPAGMPFRRKKRSSEIGSPADVIFSGALMRETQISPKVPVNREHRNI